MRTAETEVYEFNELSEQAKEHARERYRANAFDYDWWEYVYDDTKSAAELLGISINNIQFSGFWSQGDGASFTGDYRYAKGAFKRIKAWAPEDKELHRIAEGIQCLQKQYFYSLRASITRDAGSNYYSHSGTMHVDVWDSRRSMYADLGDAEDDLADLMRSFADWIYTRLEREFEFLTSDEQIDEAICANEYEFTEDGSIY